MDPAEPHRTISMPGETGNPEEKHLCQLSSGTTLEELHQWREIMMINPMAAVNPLLTVPGQQKIPLVPSAFEPPVVERDLFSSTIAPTDPRQLCISSQFGSSALPNVNMPNMLSHRVHSGWGILPPESLKAMARRNEMIQRQHTARMEMEMHAIYQQRKIEKVNPVGLAGTGLPFLCGSETPVGSAPYHGRSTLPASDIHFHRSTLRNLSGNPMLVATGSNFVESWRQKCRRLRRGTGNQKVLDSDIECCKSQAEEKVLDQTHAMPCEENEYAKDLETEALNNHKSNETHEKSTTALANTCGELEPTYRKPWGAEGALLETEDWNSGKEKASEQDFATCGEKNGACPPVPPPSLPGTHALVAMRGNLSLDEDIQKWTVNDVHNFIGSLPGCSDYAQFFPPVTAGDIHEKSILLCGHSPACSLFCTEMRMILFPAPARVFKDHAIDGETLPLLTEEHLRSTMGLKLGPALKIQSQLLEKQLTMD